MKKRKILLFTLVCTLALSSVMAACADVVGRTQDGYIHRYTAENGQDIFFVSTEENPQILTDTDVNFDGHPDLAIVTSMGVSNTFYTFYLWDGSKYVYPQCMTDGIANYELVDGKYVVSHSNDGWAGALFKDQICVWKGSALEALRTMVSEEETVTEVDGSVTRTTTNSERLHVTLWETDKESGEQHVLWERTYDPVPEDDASYEEMTQKLWEGLK